MYLVINKCVTAVKVPNVSGHYLRNRSTLDIGVLGYIGIVQHKKHSPEVLSISPGTPCINGCAMLLLHLIYFQALNDRWWTKPCFLMKHDVCEHSWHACSQHRLPLPVFKAYSCNHSQSISNINQRNSRVWGIPTQQNQYKTIFQCSVLHSWLSARRLEYTFMRKLCLVKYV